MENSEIYHIEPITIRVLLEEASNGKIRIPNIQRPYVWQPHQLAHLIDSLMHGWPCGNLLLWRINVEDQKIFPTRPFVLSIHSNDATAGIKIVSDEEYNYLVLDGQQRIQSIILAFLNQSYGYYASSKLWNSDKGKTGGTNGAMIQKWLCFDLNGWNSEYIETNPSYFYLDYVDEADASHNIPMLRWVTQEEINQQGGLLIKLSEVLSLEPKTDAEDWLKKKIQFVLDLQISTLKVTAALKGDINEDETIVQIFTRLNTAGTPLTTEQVQAARIKSVWADFPNAIDKIKTILYRRFRYEIETDEIVRGFNTMLLVKEGRKDLNVAKMYANIPREQWKEDWNKFVNAVIYVISVFENKQLSYKREYRALYIIWFSVAAIVKFSQKLNDDDLEDYLVRFAVITTWSKIWANRSGQYVKGFIRRLIDKHSTRLTVKEWIIDEMNGIRKAAEDSITDLSANHRGSVRIYYLYLWVWTRLKRDRASLLTLFGNVNNGYDVDHILPISWFNEVPEYKPTFNQIGNCWLLSACANRSKSADSLSEYVVESGKNYAQISSLDFEERYAVMHGDDFPDNLIQAVEYINKRTSEVKEELKGYVVNNVRLYYPKFEKRQVSSLKKENVEGIYKGKEYIYYLERKYGFPVELRREHLSKIRSAMRVLEMTQNDIRNNATGAKGRPRIDKIIETLKDDRLGDNASAWKKYVFFLINENRRRNINEPHNRGNINEVRDSQDFEDFIEKLASKWDASTQGKLTFDIECSKFIMGHWSYKSQIGMERGDGKFYRKVESIFGIPLCGVSRDIEIAIGEIDKRISFLCQYDNEEWNSYLRENSMIGSAIRGIFAYLILPELKARLLAKLSGFEESCDVVNNDILDDDNSDFTGIEIKIDEDL